MEATDIPNVLYEENAVMNSKNMTQHMEDVMREKQLTEITPKAMLVVLYRANKFRMNLTILYGMIEVVSRILFSVFLKVLFDIVQDLSTQANITRAYLLSFFLGFMLLISTYAKQSQSY